MYKIKLRRQHDGYWAKIIVPATNKDMHQRKLGRPIDQLFPTRESALEFLRERAIAKLEAGKKQVAEAKRDLECIYATEDGRMGLE